MIRKSLPLLALLFCMNSYANLYTCTESDGDPKPAKEDEKIVKFEIEKTESFWVKDAGSHGVHNQKKIPFLIYYAIDSTEPFMQLSVKYEIAQLEKNCQASENVNFAALLNSLYLASNEIIICKKTVLKKIKLDMYPDLDFKLKLKLKSIGEDDHTTNEKGPMSFLVKYENDINKPFLSFPLAHPDFLFDLVKLLITEESLFPTAKYLPYLNLKSHGSARTVLSGLQSCQIKAKTQTQVDILNDVLTVTGAQELMALSESQELYNNLEIFDQTLNKLNLGNSAGEISMGVRSQMGFRSQMSFRSNMGIAIAGLGANNGLGAEKAFGLHHSALNEVLGKLFNKKNKTTLGFVMLESCDTNRDATFYHYSLPNILGMYSAKYSLWYRNLNWWTLLENSKNSTSKLIDSLEINTKEIANFREVE